jgi:hypothetical protein
VVVHPNASKYQSSGFDIVLAHYGLIGLQLQPLVVDDDAVEVERSL